jgi:hypothetical protein
MAVQNEFQQAKSVVVLWPLRGVLVDHTRLSLLKRKIIFLLLTSDDFSSESNTQKSEDPYERIRPAYLCVEKNACLEPDQKRLALADALFRKKMSDEGICHELAKLFSDIADKFDPLKWKNLCGEMRVFLRQKDPKNDKTPVKNERRTPKNLIELLIEEDKAAGQIVDGFYRCNPVDGNGHVKNDTKLMQVVVCDASPMEVEAYRAAVSSGHFLRYDATTPGVDENGNKFAASKKDSIGFMTKQGVAEADIKFVAVVGDANGFHMAREAGVHEIVHWNPKDPQKLMNAVRPVAVSGSLSAPAFRR